MELKDITLERFYKIQNAVSTPEEARDIAIEWQKWSSEQSLSYGELAEYQGYLQALAEKFELVEEFRENGII